MMKQTVCRVKHIMMTAKSMITIDMKNNSLRYYRIKYFQAISMQVSCLAMIIAAFIDPLDLSMVRSSTLIISFAFMHFGTNNFYKSAMVLYRGRAKIIGIHETIALFVKTFFSLHYAAILACFVLSLLIHYKVV